MSESLVCSEVCTLQGSRKLKGEIGAAYVSFL